MVGLWSTTVLPWSTPNHGLLSLTHPHMCLVIFLIHVGLGLSLPPRAQPQIPLRKRKSSP